MANEATIGLNVRLNNFIAGLNAALKLGSNFVMSFDQIMKRTNPKIDIEVDKKPLLDYESLLKAASNQTLDVNEQPAIDGMDRAANEADKTGQRIRNENMKNAASFAMVVTGINAAITIMANLVKKVEAFEQQGVEAEQSQLKFVESLKAAGIYTPEYEKFVGKYIDQTMKWTGVNDENIKMQTKMALQIHSFSQEELPGAIDAAIGLSKAFDTDLRNAFQMLARSAEGLPVRLAQYGVSVKGAEDATVSFTDLMEKGRSGAEQLRVAMDSASGAAIRKSVSFKELTERISEMINKSMQPLYSLVIKLSDAWRENDSLLNGLLGMIVTVTGAVLAYKTVVGLASLATKTIAAVTAIWNGTLALNPIGAIVLAIGFLIGGLYTLSKILGVDLMEAWTQVWSGAIAGIMSTWEYIKGFGVFIVNWAGLMLKTITYPFTALWNIGKDVFGKLAGMMKKLLAGDFKGVMDDITSSVKVGLAETNTAFTSQLGKLADSWQTAKANADKIWASRDRVLSQFGGDKGKSDSGALRQAQGDTSASTGETPEQKAAREQAEKDRLAAVDEYYSTMKWQAADYQSYMEGKYEAERLAYIKLTKDEKQAGALKDLKLKELAKNKADYEKQLRDDAIKAERAPFEAAKTTIEEHLKRLENWKALGLSVSDDLKKTWDDYFNLLKTRMQSSEKAYQDASSGKVVVSEEELARLKAIYELDYDNYLSSLDKKKQADLMAVDAMIAAWEKNHQFAVKSLNGIKSGFDTMWDSILNKQMTGKQRADAIWKSMLGSWMNSLGDYVNEFAVKQAKLLLIHTAAEKAKTAVTATNEGVRAAIHRTTVLEQIALDIWAGIKFVAIKLWETAAALTKFYSFLGPLAPVAAIATMAVAVVPMVAAFRKGFKEGGWTGGSNPTKIAGAVHEEEIVYESRIAKPNASALLGLRKMLQKGYKLADLLIPNISIPWAPVPQVAYSYAGGGQANGDMEAMIDRVISKRLVGLEMKSTITFTDKMMVIASRIVEKGGKLRRWLG